MDILTRIRQLGEANGIDYIGVAGIERYHNEISEIGGRGRQPVSQERCPSALHSQTALSTA